MKQTWRWFGPVDKITIRDLKHVGVEGVVSALHHIPTGDVWSINEIKKRQTEVEVLEDGSPSEISWDVVESLPVSETIKTKGANWQSHIDNYKTSLENLSQCGIKTVCYNFMPVLDWTRTQLRWELPNGARAMRFDLIDFAVFDIHILQRKNAADDYPDDVLKLVTEKHSSMSDEATHQLQNNIVAGLPGANDNWTLNDIKSLLGIYSNIDAEQLRANQVAFLKAVVPTAERLEMRLCCHPDDPPFSIMGLPRIMSTPDDYAQLMQAVDSPANGITLCTGSMGVAENVDFVPFIKEWGSRIHFVHLRNTKRFGIGFENKHSFYEDAHLDGDTDMVAVIEALLSEEKRRRSVERADHEIPMRPDHGHELLSDITAGSMPGYPLIGRMRGLAELRGIMTALSRD